MKETPLSSAARPPDPDPYFPWDHLGLRANPFQSLNRNDWLEITWLPESLRKWLKKPSYVLQITGEKGTGKTSALLALSKALAHRGLRTSYAYLPADGPLPCIDLLDDGVLIIDEAQRLSRRQRKRLMKRVRVQAKQGETPPTLIYSSHMDFSKQARGYAIGFAAYELSGFGAHELARILDRRIQHFADRRGSEIQFDSEAIEFLIGTFGADLRAMESFLYDYFQAIPAGPKITIDELQAQHNR